MTGHADVPPAAEGRLRNVGIVAHINAGKTTLSERILFDSGKQTFMGEVDDGTATLDYLTEEQRRGISISAAVTQVDWKGFRINLIDTPGHVDFTAEVERCLRVLDGVVVVLDGVRGVESQTETVWRQADRRSIPRLVFVNKLDRPGADFAASIASVVERLRVRAAPIAWPLTHEDQFVGIVDLVHVRATQWGEERVGAPPQLRELRAELIEACADFDETILADFVDERPVDGPRIDTALRRGVIAGRIVPVLPGAALHNRGVDLLLDCVCRYLPSPRDLPPVVSVDGDPPQTRAPDPAAPMCALVFKRQRDDAVVTHFARIYSGTLRPGDRVASGVDPTPAEQTVRQISVAHAMHRQPIAAALAGDVVAIETDGEFRTGDTLHAPGHPMRLEPVRFPEPVLTRVLEPVSESDAGELEAAARRLALEDPTLVVQREDSGDLVVSGMGELHLEVFGSRLARRAGDRFRFGHPRVARVETVAGRGVAAAECRSAGPAPCSSRAEVEIAPCGAPNAEIAALAEAGASELVAAALAELDGLAKSGLAHSYPAAGTRLVLRSVGTDASPEQWDTGVALALEAVAVALRKAVAEAGSVVLEPFMQCDIECPSDTMSGVLADLRSRGAEIESVEGGEGRSRIRAEVALAELLGYATGLRSLTRGLGHVDMLPRRFAERPEPG